MWRNFFSFWKNLKIRELEESLISFDFYNFWAKTFHELWPKEVLCYSQPFAFPFILNFFHGKLLSMPIQMGSSIRKILTVWSFLCFYHKLCEEFVGLHVFLLKTCQILCHNHKQIEHLWKLSQCAFQKEILPHLSIDL